MVDDIKFKRDLDRLIKQGERLQASLVVAEYPEEAKRFKDVKLPIFAIDYQSWYSEALAVVSQLLPARVSDFVAYYKPARARKNLDAENYTISDALMGLTSSFGGDTRADRKAAIPKLTQQVKILDSLKNRFTSSLYDLSTILQADLYDQEVDAAAALLKQGFTRAAGALAGVVLESHLKTVCDNHGIKITKKNPTISEFNDKLKGENIIEVTTWRKIQYLGDLRNLCSHRKDDDPTDEQVSDLIDGVKKILHTVL
ncbi:hypothetical protein [Amycolatopsis keratiniphila]|uniref:hypothetical protein n=1 Tax=Amycolatopsis keratiniphila TaxID=129921 RepID=UPI0009DDC656|nr:hypothetical protein [Amycolatopsis keratiniphila]